MCIFQYNLLFKPVSKNKRYINNNNIDNNDNNMHVRIFLQLTFC